MLTWESAVEFGQAVVSQPCSTHIQDGVTSLDVIMLGKEEFIF